MTRGLSYAKLPALIKTWGAEDGASEWSPSICERHGLEEPCVDLSLQRNFVFQSRMDAVCMFIQTYTHRPACTNAVPVAAMELS